MATSSTFAWYTADQNAAVNANTATGNLTVTSTTINLDAVSVDFTVTPADAELELSHVATSAEASIGLGNLAASALDQGDLVIGAISNGAATMRKATAVTNLISSYSITASWHGGTPTDPATVAYLKNKKFTINLSVTGQAKLLAASAVTGLTNATAGTAVVHIANADGLGLTVDTLSHGYVHIEPVNLDATESSTVGAIVVDAAEGVTLTANS